MSKHRDRLRRMVLAGTLAVSFTGASAAIEGA